MNKRISLGLAIALILLSITATFAVTMTFSQNIYNSLISRLSNRGELSDRIETIDTYVRANFYGELKNDKLLAESAEGYLKGLGDPGSFYMTAQEYIEYTRRNKGEGGIGVLAQYDKDKEQVVIAEVYSGSSAENAGLQKGDIIVKLDDEKVTASNAASVIEALQVGRRFESVTLEYKRSGISKTVSVMRGYTRTATSSFSGDVGYINISAFYDNTAEQFAAQLDELNLQGVTSMIIDLRGCSNGTMANAAAVADYLLPSGAESSGAVAAAIKPDGTTYKNFTSDASALTFPDGMIVIVDETTSGAAELFAAQLKDFSKASLLGAQTAGQMTMQEIYQLDDGSAISLTVAKVISYSTTSYCDGKGIVPDFLVELTAESTKANNIEGLGTDSQLQAAYAALVS